MPTYHLELSFSMKTFFHVNLPFPLGNSFRIQQLALSFPLFLAVLDTLTSLLDFIIIKHWGVYIGPHFLFLPSSYPKILQVSIFFA